MTFFTDDGSRLQAVVQGDRDRTTIVLTGELDLVSGPSLTRLLDTAMSGGTEHLDVDMAQLGFVDVAGVRVLLDACRLAAERGIKLRVCDPAPHVVWLLRTIGYAAALLGDDVPVDDALPYPGGPAPTAGPARADERDRRADERDEQADDRDRLAQERDRLVDERDQRVREHQRWEDLREDLADARERAIERREQQQ